MDLLLDWSTFSCPSVVIIISEKSLRIILKAKKGTEKPHENKKAQLRQSDYLKEEFI